MPIVYHEKAWNFPVIALIFAIFARHFTAYRLHREQKHDVRKQKLSVRC